MQLYFISYDKLSTTRFKILMGWYKGDVTPLLTHWSYVSFALTPLLYLFQVQMITWAMYPQHVAPTDPLLADVLTPSHQTVANPRSLKQNQAKWGIMFITATLNNKYKHQNSTLLAFWARQTPGSNSLGAVSVCSSRTFHNCSKMYATKIRQNKAIHRNEIKRERSAYTTMVTGFSTINWAPIQYKDDILPV